MGLWVNYKAETYTKSPSDPYEHPSHLWSQNVADIKKLKSVGICTVKGIQMTTRKALCNIKGLSEAKVEKIKEAAGKMLVKLHFIFWNSWKCCGQKNVFFCFFFQRKQMYLINFYSL